MTEGGACIFGFTLEEGVAPLQVLVLTLEVADQGQGTLIVTY
jgi:hypothetical protein